MVEERLEILKTQVESLHFAAMKIVGKHFSKVNRVLLETIRMDDQGTIWATSKETLPKILITPKGFNVQLRYVNKDQEKYLQIEGRAFIEEYSEHVSDLSEADKVTFTNSNSILVRIEVQRAEFFKRKYSHDTHPFFNLYGVFRLAD